MKTADEKIVWVIWFCQVDLAIFRPGDWLNLTNDIQEFLEGSVPIDSTVKRETLQETQKEVRQYLEGLSHHLRQTPTEAKWKLTVPTQDMYKVSFLGFGPGHWKILVQASFHTALFFYLGLTLTAVDTDRIRSCLDCTKLFFAEHGRQRFCSQKCKNRDGVQRFRERHSEELRTKAHARYEKKVREKSGRPLQKVGQFRKAKAAKGKG